MTTRRSTQALFSALLLLMAGCGDDSTTPQGGAGPGGNGGGGGENVGAGSEGGGGNGEGGAPGLSAEVDQCLFVNACQAEGGEPLGMQACLGHFYNRQWHWASYGDYRLEMEKMDCRLAATDCAGVSACDTDPAAFDAECAATPGDTLCVDDTWVVCDFDGAATAAFDCSAAGQSCNKDIWAGCGTETCTFGDVSTCDADDPDVLVLCNAAGFIERVDCTAENNFVQINGKEEELVATIAGETCGDDPMLGSKGCIGTGASCDFFSQECDGDSLITCAGGQLATRDCATQSPAGQSCGFVTAGPFTGGAACGVTESSCDGEGDEACEGGVITFCAQGQSQTVSCSEAGFASCATADSGGRTVAFCTE